MSAERLDFLYTLKPNECQAEGEPWPTRQWSMIVCTFGSLRFEGSFAMAASSDLLAGV